MKQATNQVCFVLLLGTLFVTASPGCSSQSSPSEDEVRATSQGLRAPDSPPTAVLKAAQSQLAELLESIPPGMEGDYGFTGRDEFGRATLAQPYEMLSVEGGGSVAALQEWRVPVVVDDQFRTLIDVQKSGDTYSAVGIGAAQLASELGQAETDSTATPSRQKSTQKFVLRSFKHTADFVVYDLDPRQAQNVSKLKIRPLKSAHLSLSAKADRLRAAGKSFGVTGGNARTKELTMSDVQLLLDE